MIELRKTKAGFCLESLLKNQSVFSPENRFTANCVAGINIAIHALNKHKRKEIRYNALTNTTEQHTKNSNTTAKPVTTLCAYHVHPIAIYGSLIF